MSEFLLIWISLEPGKDCAVFTAMREKSTVLSSYFLVGKAMKTKKQTKKHEKKVKKWSLNNILATVFD